MNNFIIHDSIIHDLLSDKLHAYREKLQKQNSYLSSSLKEERDELEKTLTPEQLKLVDKYIFSLSMWNDDISAEVEIMAINYGIKIGMELQTFFLSELNPCDPACYDDDVYGDKNR